MLAAAAQTPAPSPPAPATLVPPPPPPPAPSPDGNAAIPPGDEQVPEAASEPVAVPAATLRALDKVAGRVRQIDIGVGETLRSGALSVTLRACRSRPDDALPDSAAFVEVNEIRADSGVALRLFTGWMFAAAPAVSALDHPVYDVWLVACSTSARGSSR
jgi:hypothetical protein